MGNTIRNYRNKIILNFINCGNNFTLKVPHHGKWISIINYLTKRGFNITENKTYKEHYDVLSKYHKIGFKNDVALLMEIDASSIKVEFGNIKNLWQDMQQSFWDDPSDERFAKLTYLENIAVKLEIKKLIEYCKKFNLSFQKEDCDLSPEEYIINKLRINKHIHGEVNSLDDIQKSISKESYDWVHNSNDKNKNKILGGQLKYFYDYNKRLSCGIVYHNINNMWWVICNGNLRNIASFDLFDFNKDLPRRQPTHKSYIDRLLGKFERKRDYKRCLAIQQFHKKIK